MTIEECAKKLEKQKTKYTHKADEAAKETTNARYTGRASALEDVIDELSKVERTDDAMYDLRCMLREKEREAQYKSMTEDFDASYSTVDGEAAYYHGYQLGMAEALKHMSDIESFDKEDEEEYDR